MGYQKSYIEEGQTIQWPKEKREKGRLFITFNILITSFYYISEVLLIVTKANWLQLQRTGNVRSQRYTYTHKGNRNRENM